jgi:hypothetical protein
MDKKVIISDIVDVSSNASDSASGWDFQRNAAIVLMLLNIEKAKSVKVEGDSEDIEISLNNGKVIYSQAKFVADPDNTNPVIKNLEKSLKTLNNAAKNDNFEDLIYITNSSNPFNSVKTLRVFSSGLNMLPYSDLPEICKKKIDEILKKNKYNLDKDCLSVYVLQFYGSKNENKYKVIKEQINEFLNKLSFSSLGKEGELLNLWQNEFFINATEHNRKLKISKAQMIWPLIVSICELNREDAILSACDDGEFDEIKHEYKTIIDNNSERFSFITKVLTSFSQYDAPSNGNKAELFIFNNWKDYESEFSLDNVEKEIKEKVIKLTLSNVIKKRYTIDKIKKGVHL